jgi:CheY-like chemotaxis protein
MQAADAMRPDAATRGITLDVSLERAAGATVLADAARLQQVVWNLLSNAVKFTPPGGRVSLEAARAGFALQIIVRDTGVGISREFLPHVFERFRQADSTTTRAHGGLGLGLAIARHLVDLHGGRIAATSDGPGRGATFTVHLPLEDVHAVGPPEDTRRARDVSSLAGLDVMVVDDQEDARDIMSAVLRGHGARVLIAESAATALARYSEEHVDVVVADLGMPEHDGYWLLARLRALEAERGAPPAVAIAVTAYARAEDRRRATAAGFQEHIAKPVDPLELVRVVRALADAAVASPARAVGDLSDGSASH